MNAHAPQIHNATESCRQLWNGGWNKKKYTSQFLMNSPVFSLKIWIATQKWTELWTSGAVQIGTHLLFKTWRWPSLSMSIKRQSFVQTITLLRRLRQTYQQTGHSLWLYSTYSPLVALWWSLYFVLPGINFYLTYDLPKTSRLQWVLRINLIWPNKIAGVNQTCLAEI